MKSILAVDDEQTILSLLDEELSGKGYRVFTTTVPETALAILKENHIDLVLLDVRMPKISGLDLCRQLLERQQVPVLFVTGYSNSFVGDSRQVHELWKEQFAQGTTDIIYKPFSFALLLEKVASLIGPSEPETGRGGPNLETNRFVRKVLVQHWIDLGRISLSTENGLVRLMGLISRLSKAGVDINEPTTLSILSEIKSIPSVKDVVLKPINLIDLESQLMSAAPSN